MNTTEIDYSIVLNNLPLLCFWKDFKSNYLGCNPENLKAIKMKDINQFIGKSDYDMPWKDQADKFLKQDKLALKGKIHLGVEALTAMDGTQSNFLIKKAPMYDQNKKIIGVIGTGFTLTRNNYKEAALLLTGSNLKISNLYAHISKKNPDFVYGDIKFTKRQAQVISHFLKGHSAEKTAEHLGLSRRTVESSIVLLKAKLKSSEKHQIIDKAITLGFVDLMFRNIS